MQLVAARHSNSIWSVSPGIFIPPIGHPKGVGPRRCQQQPAIGAYLLLSDPTRRRGRTTLTIYVRQDCPVIASNQLHA